ncbi:MAG: LytTR family DNA-binding domain-containing protein [Cyclobacteriaceae bacterium]|nr:LytTR family DNA-binding domain-containing protein [Cyclobacteriaceae bacterium]
MKKIRCAIIDDEQPARKLVQNFALKTGILEVIGEFRNPLEAMPLIINEEIDLLFLDIQMPEMKGTEFLKSLDKRPMVILTTAYDEYALEGFNLDVVDYLLKPFSFERFLKAVNKVSSRLSKHGNNQPEEEILSIQADHKTYKLPVKDILYIEGLKEYVSYYTLDGKRIVALQSLKDLETSLSEEFFLRVHKSYIIQKKHIKYYDSNSVMIHNKLIPIGGSYKENVLRVLG